MGKINKIYKYLLVIATLFVVVPVAIGITLAVSPFQSEADEYLDRVCNRRSVRNLNAVLCYFRDRLDANIAVR